MKAVVSCSENPTLGVREDGAATSLAGLTYRHRPVQPNPLRKISPLFQVSKMDHLMESLAGVGR